MSDLFQSFRADCLEHLLRILRRLYHVVVPHGCSPESYRRLVRALQERLVYDARTQTVTVKKGELAGFKKYGPFCPSDFEFALGRYEPEVTAAFKTYCHPGMTVFDIGAAAGHHTLLLSKLCGPPGHVHAFEPVPQNAECLRETLRINGLQNVTVHRLAVSDKQGTALFRFCGPFDGYGSLVAGGHGHCDNPDAVGGTTIPVATTDLDTFCQGHAIGRIGLVKMDIEGAEMLALRGMAGILRAAKPVLILELWGSDHIAEGLQLLRSLGYTTRRLSTWAGFVDGELVETANVLGVGQ